MINEFLENFYSYYGQILRPFLFLLFYCKTSWHFLIYKKNDALPMDIQYQCWIHSYSLLNHIDLAIGQINVSTSSMRAPYMRLWDLFRVWSEAPDSKQIENIQILHWIVIYELIWRLNRSVISLIKFDSFFLYIRF